MALFMNEMDIEQAVQWHGSHPVIGRALLVLIKFVDTINQNSDGWSYWKLPKKAADKLMTLIQEHDRLVREHREPTATMEQLKKALSPIKAFCTRHKLPYPEIENE